MIQVPATKEWPFRFGVPDKNVENRSFEALDTKAAVGYLPSKLATFLATLLAILASACVKIRR